jgi:hypothetical protein
MVLPLLRGLLLVLAKLRPTCRSHGRCSIVRVARLAPQTESDPAALLLTYLASFGSAIGRIPYYEVEATKHFANLFVLLVGDTAKARKGTAANRIRSLFELADPIWEKECIHGGLSSGEGMITAVRDASYSMRKGVPELIDPGIQDKRVLFFESEFSSVLAKLNLESNILSRVVRDAWDCRPIIGTLTKHSPTRATEPYMSIIGHITIAELQRKLDETSMANGFANRFLLACVRRARLLPRGGQFEERERQELGERARKALMTARTIERIKMADAAGEWDAEYRTLTESGNSLTDHMTARAEAQVIRLALIYALLDQSPAIELMHLKSALALRRFCKASVRYVFGELTGDSIADAILRDLRAAGSSGLTRTDISGIFGRNLAVQKITAALMRLLAAGKVRQERQPTAGRVRETWFVI